VGARAAQLLGRDDLVGHGFDHVGPGDKHVGGIAHHEDEVGHGRRIDRAAGAGAHDHGNLRDNARRLDIAPEHFRIAGQGGDALLDTGAAAVVEADHRRAVAHRHVHDLADLLRMRFRQRTAEHGEVLREHIDEPAVDRCPIR
jgi:hypothetical protein